MLVWVPRGPVVHWLLRVAQQSSDLAPNPATCSTDSQVSAQAQVEAPLVFCLLSGFSFTLFTEARFTNIKLFKTFKWHLLHSQCCAMTPLSNSKTGPSLQTSLLTHQFASPLLDSWQSALCIYLYLISHINGIISHGTFRCGSFTFTNVFPSSATL